MVWPDVSNQGNADACHRHALGKCLCALFQCLTINLKQEMAIESFKQIFQDCRSKNPLNYDGKKLYINNTDSHFTAKLCIKEIKADSYNSIKLNEQSSIWYVLAYTLDCGDLHVVYISRKVGETFVCINSHGLNNNPHLEFKCDSTDIKFIYSLEVTVTVEILNDFSDYKEGEIIPGVKLSAAAGGGWYMNGKSVPEPTNNYVQLIEDKQDVIEATVLYDFQAIEDYHLALRKDEVIKVLIQDGSGWWTGELNGKRGIFPGNLVQVIQKPVQAADETDALPDSTKVQGNESIADNEICNGNVDQTFSNFTLIEELNVICEKDIYVKLSAATIDCIKFKFIREFAKELDTTDINCPSWHSFGRNIADLLKTSMNNIYEYEALVSKIDDCEKSYYGGGSCGKALLETLATCQPGLLVSEFCSVAEDLGRQDIMELLNKECGSDKLNYIAYDKQLKLFVLLHKGGDEKNYRAFAGELKLADDTIKAIDREKITCGRFSPTESLFEILKHTYPRLPLVVIYNALKNIGSHSLKSKFVKEFVTKD